jgi:CRP/FNR family cyclic AMP-dependent transcriptional regulator
MKNDSDSVSLEFLKQHSLFGGIQMAELIMIRTLFKEEHFSKGEDILREGDPGDRLYFIKEGSVEITKQGLSPKRPAFRRIAILRRGDTFGEMALIDMEPRCATVRALEETTTLSLDCKNLYDIAKSNLKTYTLIMLNMSREISRRLRKMDERFASSLFSID